MSSFFTDEEYRIIKRIGEDPYYWVRNYIPEARDWENEFYTLVDKLKLAWKTHRHFRVNLCFILEWVAPFSTDHPFGDIDNCVNLIIRQSDSNSKLLFQIDLFGRVREEVPTIEEVEPNLAKVVSQLRTAVVFWLGPEFEVFYEGRTWETRNKTEILKDIKSKRRDHLLSMSDWRKVLDQHFEQFIRGSSGTTYWFSGMTNKVLVDSPEEIFQKSLCSFLNRDVDCEAEREHMFKDGSRCDIKVWVDNYDLYFIEIKWIGKSASKSRGKHIVSADSPWESTPARAIAGAYQTKIYIETNNHIEYDGKIKLGIFLLYDAYPKSVIPLDYGEEIHTYPLLKVVEYSLIHNPPSVTGKMAAKSKGLI